MNPPNENEDVKTALYHMMVLLAQTAEATADLVDQSTSAVARQQVASTRDKAESIRQKAKTLRDWLGKFQPK